MRRYVLAVDYRTVGIRIYQFYNYDQAIKCFENNAVEDQRDIVLSVALFDIADPYGAAELLKMKIWRNEK